MAWRSPVTAHVFYEKCLIVQVCVHITHVDKMISQISGCYSASVTQPAHTLTEHAPVSGAPTCSTHVHSVHTTLTGGVL